jgi:hypothetical protein
MAESSHEWQPMETAPEDRHIDIVAKRYDPRTDAFVLRRFTDCYWFVPHPSARAKPHWHGVPPDEFRPVCWMEIPKFAPLPETYFEHLIKAQDRAMETYEKNRED